MNVCLPVLMSALLLTNSLAQVPFEELPGNDVFNLEHAWGLALGDYDNDGDDDIFVPANPSRLLINQGNGQFSANIAQFANDISKAAVWVDIDDDGWLDLVTTSWESSGIYHNDGNGNFTLTGKLKTSKRQALLAGDLNGDHWVDVYASNFRQPNELWLNDGKGRLINIGEGSGAESNQSGMGGILIDFDEDNDLDIYLVFDGKEPNHLLLNDGNGKFTENAAGFGMDTRTQGMGTDYADFNADGKYDYYITNLFHNYFMISQPDGTYLNTAPELGMDDNGMAWGLVVLDFNNDGMSDIYVNNKYGFSTYPNQLYRNNGNMVFENIAAGTSLENKMAGFGCGVSDLDNDGRQDILVINEDSENSVRIFRNTSGSGNWLQFSLVGSQVNKFAAGSKVSVYSGGSVWNREVTLGSGYSTQNSYRLHFGIGTRLQADSVIVTWTDGTKDTFFDVTANERYLARQGQALTVFDPDTYKTSLTKESVLGPSQGVPSVELILGEHSIAHEWNEALLYSIRRDFARPTVHARNLFHTSMAMYDMWAVYSETNSSTVFLGHNFRGFACPFEGIEIPDDAEDRIAAQQEAISYAMYRIMAHRFKNSPNVGTIERYIELLMDQLGYDINFTSVDYSGGSPAALGNYLASKIIEFGLQDGSNEQNNFANLYYTTINDPLDPTKPGNPDISDPDRWQPLSLNNFIDQSGNPVGDVPPFLGPEWGKVKPFSLRSKDLTIKRRDDQEYWVYHDPGPPPGITDGVGLNDDYKWNHTLVAVWSSHLDPTVNGMIDISPASNGNNRSYPTNSSEMRDFYDLINGGDHSTGYAVNPFTGEPYEPQMVPLGDYARILAEFWADGPASETPPGHWFTILNYVNEHPDLERRYRGEGPIIDQLEWDVKSYLIMGGAMHDVAITAWGIKGYYDYVRPISAIRYMADKGQSSDPMMPRYHPHGLPLIPGKVELVKAGDPLAGVNNQFVNQVKVFAWRGPDYIENPDTDEAGAGWILAGNWWPYQRPTFVTPPFAGYISGHSTFSSAGAQVLELLTGDEYFPGGLGIFHAPENEFLVFEEGPSMDVYLQWARYRDASDHSSMSRIWGGIHPPADDIPGRHIGIVIGNEAFELADAYFTNTITSAPEFSTEEPLIIYPNPVQGGGILKMRHTKIPSQIILSDISGRKILTASGQSFSQGGLPVPQLTAGVYILQVDFGQRSETHRLIIK